MVNRMYMEQKPWIRVYMLQTSRDFGPVSRDRVISLTNI